MFMDKCGDTVSSDTAEFIAVGVFSVGIAATIWINRSVFAATLLALSVFRAMWGAPTPTGFGVALILNSRAAVAWQTNLVTWAHLIYSKSGVIYTTLYIVLSYAYVATAWALALISVVFSATSTEQPTPVYFAFDVVGVVMALLWLYR